MAHLLEDERSLYYNIITNNFGFLFQPANIIEELFPDNPRESFLQDANDMEDMDLKAEYEMSLSDDLYDISNSTLTHTDYPFVSVFTGKQDYLSHCNQNPEPTLTMLNSDCSIFGAIKTEQLLQSAEAIFNCDNEKKIASFVNKRVTTWNKQQVTLWAAYVSMKYDLSLFGKSVTGFCDINGEQLSMMSLDDLRSIIKDDSIAVKYFEELKYFIYNSSAEGDKLEGKVLHALQNVSIDNNARFDSIMETNTEETENVCLKKIIEDVTDSGVDSGDESLSEGEMHSGSVDNEQTNYPPIKMDDGYGILDVISKLYPEFTVDDDVSQYPLVLNNAGVNLVNDTQMAVVDNGCAKKQRLPKKKVGRPPGSKKPKKEKKIGKLWENIKDWLYDPRYNPDIICWENYNAGIFRFVNSTKAAKLWGKIKHNQEMTFEKMTRAMRYHYKNNILKSVDKKLFYQFGEKAYGWRRPNPIL